MDDLDVCTFEWHDKDGRHRCDDFRVHDEHHCCCGSTMQPARPVAPRRRKERR